MLSFGNCNADAIEEHLRTHALPTPPTPPSGATPAARAELLERIRAAPIATRWRAPQQLPSLWPVVEETWASIHAPAWAAFAGARGGAEHQRKNRGARPLPLLMLLLSRRGHLPQRR
jgi:hypothetical protein